MVCFNSGWNSQWMSMDVLQGNSYVVERMLLPLQSLVFVSHPLNMIESVPGYEIGWIYTWNGYVIINRNCDFTWFYQWAGTWCRLSLWSLIFYQETSGLRRFSQAMFSWLVVFKILFSCRHSGRRQMMESPWTGRLCSCSNWLTRPCWWLVVVKMCF